MKRVNSFAKTYRGKALIADPVYTYIWFTVPVADHPSEKTEKDLIDSPWMQRLRRIYQLQSARWVFPAAEHTRFQHVLGTMHMAGEFSRHLYQGLKELCPDVPSVNFVEELLRVAGMLHDVGHGPYGHFFDDHFLSQYGLTHEILGQEIIVRELGSIIRKIRRSPTGDFEPGETIDPRQVAVWSAMEPADRLDIAFQAYQFALDALRTRERERHPDLEPQELAWHVTRRMQRDPTLGT